MSSSSIGTSSAHADASAAWTPICAATFMVSPPGCQGSGSQAEMSPRMVPIDALHRHDVDDGLDHVGGVGVDGARLVGGVDGVEHALAHGGLDLLLRDAGREASVPRVSWEPTATTTSATGTFSAQAARATPSSAIRAVMRPMSCPVSPHSTGSHGGASSVAQRTTWATGRTSAAPRRNSASEPSRTPAVSASPTASSTPWRSASSISSGERPVPSSPSAPCGLTSASASASRLVPRRQAVRSSATSTIRWATAAAAVSPFGAVGTSRDEQGSAVAVGS